MTTRTAYLFVALLLSITLFFSCRAEAEEFISTSRMPSEQEARNMSYCEAYSVVSGRVFAFKRRGLTLKQVVAIHQAEMDQLEAATNDQRIVAVVRGDLSMARIRVFNDGHAPNLASWQQMEEKWCMRTKFYEGKRIN